MRSLLGKIKSCVGETLVETLCAVLICGLAAALLMTSLGTASTLNHDARISSREIEKQEANAARFSGSPSTGKVTVSVRGDNSIPPVTFDAKVYGGSLIASYEVTEDEG